MIEKEEIKKYAEEFFKDSMDYLVDITITPSSVISVEIDNDENVEIDRCISLSRFIESKLDREIEDFELTVGSAGLTSPLKVQRQYKKYIDKEVEVLTKDGIKESGILKSFNSDEFTIEVSKKVKPEGAKRKIEVKELHSYNYDEVKYTKYKIRF